MKKMSTYAKHGKEVFIYAAKSISMQLSPYFRINVSVCLLAMVPQSGEQRWRRFLFCLQPARLAVAAKYSTLSLRGILLLLAFPALFLQSIA